MKTSVISLIALAAVVAAAGVQPGAHSNTNAVPNIVVSPPGDGNGAIDNTVRPNDNNRLGQYWMQYGICDTRTRKTTCKIQSIPSGKRWVGYKCRNKCTEGTCRIDSTQPGEPADCSVPKQQ
ncbi:hypothetical protein ANOM_005992 [Aspergillus nomiae NRRL 13137]|uniref:Uncharacterized protein n=1 Tax=Aspergillus nomiae NRRL (strain ATCC 15546 / NRRL 13137 / CBS 260.88 / M93) TaxID=1509407 RepID=A0A0L1J3F2_ASPN3|nr:uncharacterized protein ANOM_005992 [Aspergillus nomiae NRRL 13137]KNG86200.1 hypothetical protein ANOM_005992 [Aspergillus nomiae NRRL 13137]